MRPQNVKNHSRIIPLWHIITTIVLLALLIGSIINLVHSDASSHYSAALLVVIAVLLFIFFWYTRWFALRAQDRAIRAEENFRHFILTGKPFDKKIRLGQIIALRFASDEEFPALANRAVAESLSSRQIKEAIQNWRADHHRV
jgi:cbb3-type cytochrome oxidase subunit 3